MKELTTFKKPAISQLKLFRKVIFTWWKDNFCPNICGKPFLYNILIKRRIMHLFTKRFEWISYCFLQYLKKKAKSRDPKVKFKVQNRRISKFKNSSGGVFFLKESLENCIMIKNIGQFIYDIQNVVVIYTLNTLKPS